MKPSTVPRKAPGIPSASKQPGHQAQSNAKRAPYDQEEYDKILITFLNRESDNNSKKWIVKDLETLTQDQFLQIILLILPEAPDSLKNALLGARGSFAPLKAFNARHKDFRCQLNVGWKKTYQALQTLFHNDPNLLLPATVINPSGDPVRTKRVLRYLVAFEVNCSTQWKEFADVLNDKLDEIEHKRLVTDQLAKVVEQINVRTIQLFDWEQEVVSLKKQSQEKQAAIVKLGEKINRLEYEAKADKETYLEKERDLQRTRNQISSLKVEAEEAEKLVVNDTNKIKQDYNREKQMLDSLCKEREAYNAEISRLEERRNMVSSIGETVGRISSLLVDLVGVMQDVGESKSEAVTYTKEENALRQEKQELLSQIEEFRNMLPMQGLSEVEVNKMVQEIQSSRANLAVLEQSLQKVKEEMDALNIEAQRQLAEWEGNNTILEELTKDISENRHYVEIELPEKRRDLITIMELMVQSLEDDIARYVESARRIME